MLDRTAVSLAEQMREKKTIICSRRGEGMADLLSSTIRPSPLFGCPLGPNSTMRLLRGGQSVQVCSSFQSHFKYLRSHDVKSSLMNRAGNLAAEAISSKISSRQMFPIKATKCV
jgi:hypothetical protein